MSRSDHDVCAVDRESVWLVRHLLERLEPWCTPVTAAQMEEAIASGALGAMAILDGDDILGIVVMQSVHYPGGEREAHVVGVAGERFREWADEFERIAQAYAMAAGCIRIRCTARPGMHRLLSRRGWSDRGIVMEMSAWDPSSAAP